MKTKYASDVHQNTKPIQIKAKWMKDEETNTTQSIMPYKLE